MKKYLFSIILCISILASIFAFSSCSHGAINSDTETQSESPKTAMLFLDLNGGSLRQGEEKLYEYESGEKVRFLPTPTKSGYIFAGWYNAYTDKQFESPFVIEENTTFYAKWTLDDVIVTIDTNGGMIKNWSSEFEWSRGDSLNLGDPTKEGFEFVGWEVNVEKIEFPYTITEDVTFVATWKKIPQPVKITFNLNGGTMNGEKIVEYESGTRVTSLPTPTKDGAVFLGWYNLAQDDKAASTAKIVIIPFKVTEDIEIYAWWMVLPGSSDTESDTPSDTETGETQGLN